MVYPSAKAAIRLDPVKWQQDFNLEHTDDVLCLAISPDRKLVATGQLGTKPSIIIWDAETCATKRVLRGFHRRAVLQVRNSPRATHGFVRTSATWPYFRRRHPPIPSSLSDAALACMTRLRRNRA